MNEKPSENTIFPLITIGVSAYNRKDFLALSLDSLLAQTYPRCQIIVIDDGSTDGTKELMLEKYPSIQYVYQKNAGDAAAKNHAARLAQGEYIVFNDSDDLFFPDTVERLYHALAGKKNTCSYGTYQTIDAKGNILPTKKKVKDYPSGNITEKLLSHIVVNNCGTLIPVKYFRNGYKFDEKLKVSYDYAFFLQLSLECEFAAVQEPVFYRRRHSSNLSGATYEKLLISFGVFDSFIKSHPEIREKYPETTGRRYADYHNKLYREAKKEKKKEERFFHAKAAWKARPSLKNLVRYLISF